MDENLTDAERALVSRVKAETQSVQASAPPAAEPLLSKARWGLARSKREEGVKRSLIPLAIGLVVVGFILTVLFIIFMQSTAQQMGSVDYFNELSEQLAGSSAYDELFNSAGLGWYKDFLNLYKMRWMLAGAIFTTFILLAAFTFIIDIARRGSK
jgi:hypothetical protein